jgi:hypothetical protein
MKRLLLTLAKCGLIALLLAGWMSCGQDQADTTLPPEEPVEVIPKDTVPIEKPYAVAEIENLQTQLYVFKLTDPDEDITKIWSLPKQEGVIFHCLSVPSFKIPELSTGIRFGYVDNENRTIICEVSNFPEEVLQLQWEGVAVYMGNHADSIVMRVNIRMSGTVQLYSKDTENGVERFGTLELTSITKDDDKKTLDFGMYTETDPDKGTTQINVVNEEKLVIIKYYSLPVFNEETQKYDYVRDDSREIFSSDEFHYKILDDVISLKYNSSGAVYESILYFHIFDDSKIEMIKGGSVIGTFPITRIIMTLEKEQTK